MADLYPNPKKYDPGTVVYYIKKYGHSWSISFATVYDNYSDAVILKLYEFRDMRRIEGVPAKEFVTPTRWRKLPRGWNYNTELVDVSFDRDPAWETPFSIRKPETILHAIEIGALVWERENDHAQFRAEIDARRGWRIVRDYSARLGKSESGFTSIRFDQVYGSYDEAKAVVDAHEAELRRQASLTEAEWSIEQIDHELDRWAALYHIPDDTKNRYRDWILALKPIEDIEVRLCSGELQWKHWKHKNWKNIEL